MPEPDKHNLRRAFGSFMTGVTVVTTRTPSGEFIGFTANSFTSVSLDPPLLAVCPGKHLNSFDVFNTVTHFAVNILGEGQENISNIFAKAGDDRFASVNTDLDDFGSPLISGACATFSCKVHQRHDAGDHMILVGEILSFNHAHNLGLGYCHTGYFSLSLEQRSDTASHSTLVGVAGAIIECGGSVLFTQTKNGAALPIVEQSSTTGARSTMQNYLKSLGTDVSLGPVYSVFDNNSKGYRYTFFRAHASSTDNLDIGSFHPINSISDIDFSDPAESTMMQRFATEHENQIFGLYLGNNESGEVHSTRSDQESL